MIPNVNYMMTRVFVDGCSYNFCRVTASQAWYRKSHPGEEPPTIEDTDFLKSLEGQYHKHLLKIQKLTGVQPKDMTIVRDCPIEQIWRRKHYPKYKQKRLQRDASSVNGPGVFIKHINTKLPDIFSRVLRIREAEADDVISVLTRYYLDSTDDNIIIVTNDSDYTQVLCWDPDRVRILNPKKLEWVEQNPDVLQTKIRKGDASDEIPSARAVTEILRNKQLIDLNYVPRYIQDRVLRELGTEARGSNAPHYYKPLDLQLGLCCMHTKLCAQKPKVFCSRTAIIQTIEKTGLLSVTQDKALINRILTITKAKDQPIYWINPDEFLPEHQDIHDLIQEHQEQILASCMSVVLERAEGNCKDLLTMIQHAAEVDGTRSVRMSSDMFPHKSNPKTPDYSLEQYRPVLERAGDLSRRYKMRLTFHPGQYNVVGTPHKDKLAKTILDLDWHAEMLDIMGCDQDSVMIVHGGGVYGDKEATVKRWAQQFFELPERVRRRLVLEHCEKCFSVEDCLRISELIYEQDGLGIPVVFDTHHYDCYNILHPNETLKPAAEYMDAVLHTWNRRHIKPLFHVSEQRPGAKTGAHSDLISKLPDYLFDIKQPFDLDVEAKLKEQALDGIYRIYPELQPKINTAVPAISIKVKPVRPVQKVQPKKPIVQVMVRPVKPIRISPRIVVS